MTMEQILEKIKQDRGDAVLENGRQLAGLFADYSRGQLRSQANALDIFLKCGGNTRVLALRGAPEQTQRAEYYRLIREMTRDYSMQEAAARAVCAAFWRVSIGTEPPASLSEPEPAPNPEPAPEPQPAPLPEEKAAPSAADVPAPEVPLPKAPPAGKKLPVYTVVTLVFGFAVLAYLLYAILVTIREAGETMEILILVGILLGLAAIVLWMQRKLLRRKSVTEALGLEWDGLMKGLFLWLLPSGSFGFMGIDLLLEGHLIPIVEGYAPAFICGLAVFSWYSWFWLIPLIRITVLGLRLLHEEKKRKRGGKK